MSKFLAKSIHCPITLKPVKLRLFFTLGPIVVLLALQGRGCFPKLVWKERHFLKSKVLGPVWLYFNVYLMRLTFLSQCFMLDSILFDYRMLECYPLSLKSFYTLSLGDFIEFHGYKWYLCVDNSQIYSYIPDLPRDSRFTYSACYLIYPHG